MSKILISLVLSFVVWRSAAQPYTDIAHFSYQHFNAKHTDAASTSQTDQYALNLFLPKTFKSGDIFLFRVNAEKINSAISGQSVGSDLSAVAMPVGFQFSSKNKKWSSIILAIPKIASDFNQALAPDDWQFGGLLLQNYQVCENLKIKAGLYYNREAFGNFFVPLIGLDWKASKRWNLYGTLPTQYKIEYTLLKNRLYTGIDFKSVTRSFNLSGNNEYVRFDETLLRIFAEWFAYRNILLSGQFGYSLGKSPLQYQKGSDELTRTNPLYSPAEKYPVFQFAIAYRIRKN